MSGTFGDSMRAAMGENPMPSVPRIQEGFKLKLRAELIRIEREEGRRYSREIYPGSLSFTEEREFGDLNFAQVTAVLNHIHAALENTPHYTKP